MSKYKNYLFDLDGTLTDPGVGIKNSIRYALTKAGRPLPDESTLNEFIGPPLVASFMKYCGADDSEAQILLQLYREYFGTKGYFENTVYSGTEHILAALKEKGAKIYLATSKPDFYAVKILEHFGLLKYFDFCAGNDMSESRPKKSDVIAYLISECGLDTNECLMVGDRRYDIEGARAFGIPTAAVSFGYGSREELSAADYIIDDFCELLKI